jgi:hypothetical protein
VLNQSATLAIFRLGLLRSDVLVPPAFWYCSESLPNLAATPVSIRSLKARNNFSRCFVGKTQQLNHFRDPM